MKSAATLIELTIVSFAKPGCVLKPWKRTNIASPENVSISIWPSAAPSIVYANFAPKRGTSKCVVSPPTSSSGVKPRRTGPCGISGCATRYSAAVTISATPA